MRINFFEEFPTKKSWDKLKLINFPTTIYIAAKSLKEFNSIKKRIKKKSAQIGYWPVLAKEEGYWFSAFSKTKGLRRIMSELKQNKEKLIVMWDAELPMLKKRLFLTQASTFLLNKRLIYKFFKEADRYNIEIVTAEYAPRGILVDWLFNLFGIRHPDKNKRIYMVYSSHLKNFGSYLEKGCKRIGVGVIAPGVLGDGKTISVEQFERDLALAKKNNIKEVTIFRLGGLNKGYLKVIKKYIAY